MTAAPRKKRTYTRKTRKPEFEPWQLAVAEKMAAEGRLPTGRRKKTVYE